MPFYIRWLLIYVPLCICHIDTQYILHREYGENEQWKKIGIMGVLYLSTLTILPVLSILSILCLPPVWSILSQMHLAICALALFVSQLCLQALPICVEIGVWTVILCMYRISNMPCGTTDSCGDQCSGLDTRYVQDIQCVQQQGVLFIYIYPNEQCIESLQLMLDLFQFMGRLVFGP